MELFVVTSRYGSSCESFFTVGCRNGFLYVSKFHMFHNHNIVIRPAKPKPEPYSVIADYTNQFTDMFPSLVFSSFRQFEEKMEEFQAKTGCVYTKRHTCPWPKDDFEHRDLVYKKLAYECFHYGYKKETANERAERRSFRTGCRSAVFISCRNNALHINRFEMRHNHPISGASGNPYRNKHRLTFEQQSAVKDLLKKNEHEITIKQFIQDNFDICMTTAEVRNLKRKLKPKRPSHTSRFTLEHLEEEGFANIISNDIGERHVISFTTLALTKIFNVYPEVLQIRQFGCPSLWAYDFSVINSKLESRTVMYSFVMDYEFMGNLTPILKSFKNLMRSRWEDVETIFVDVLPLNCSEIQVEFPLARILFYRDSVLSNVKDSLKHHRFSKFNKKAVFEEFFRAVTTHDPEEYASCLQRIMHFGPSFYQDLEETLLPFADYWAEHLRLDKLTFGIANRNSDFLNHLESLLPQSKDDVDASAKRLLDVAAPPIVEDYEKFRSIDLCGQPEDVRSLLRLLSTPLASVLIRHLEKSSNSQLEVFPAPPSVRNCSCSFSLQWKLPCVHRLNAARDEYIPLPSLLKDSRWLEQWSPDYRESENVVESIIEETNHQDALSPSAKYATIDEQLHSIQEMVVTSDENKFTQRRRELKDLERRWLHEDETTSLQ